MHYFNFHIGDYKSHTHHLNLIEDLAYRRLLDHYYLHEAPIKQREIARQIGMRDHEQEVLSVLEEFFLSTEVGYINPRADAEIVKYKELSLAGKRGAEKRWSKPTQCDSNSHPIATPLAGYNPPNAMPIATKNQEPITKNQEPYEEDRHPSDTSRNSIHCQHQKVIDLYHQILPTHLKVEVWHKTRQGLLKTRWAEVEQDILKDKGTCTEEQILDWWKRFFGYIAKSKFLTGKTFTKDRRPFMADLEWIVRPTNFTKIIEQKYHGE